MPKLKLHGESFLARKRWWMKSLRASLKYRDPAWAVHPHVREAVVELNKLPFVYTDDSAGSQVFLDSSEKIEQVRRHKQTLERAKKAGRAVFRRAFVTFWLKEGHPECAGFYRALSKWQQEHYPQAAILQMAPEFSVRSPMENFFQLSTNVPGKQLDSRIEEARKFMADLHQFVRSYRLGLRRNARK